LGTSHQALDAITEIQYNGNRKGCHYSFIMYIPIIVLLFAGLCYLAGRWQKKRNEKCKHYDCPHFVINESHNQKIVTVPQNSGIILELVEQVGAGYLWELGTELAEPLEQMHEPHHLPIQAESDNGELVVGGPAKSTWRFYAKKTGTCELKLFHRQPWMPKDPKDESFACTIIIDKNAKVKGEIHVKS
jgi:predicted secreted protein